MRRGLKIALLAAASLAALLVVFMLAGILILRSTWFARQVRYKVVTSVEHSTGGRVEAPGFRFVWHQLHAEIDNFVLHGLEPAGTPPLLTARHIEVRFRLLSPFSGGIHIASLVVDTPRLNVIVFRNGTTNIPHPRVQTSTGQTLADVVDLAIGRFQVRNGFLSFAERRSSFEARGHNLTARFAYNRRHPGYTGELDISPLVVQSAARAPVSLELKLPLTIAGDRLAVADGRLGNRQSTVAFAGEVRHLDSPTGWARIRANIALADLDRAAGLDLALARKPAPPRLEAQINAAIGAHQIDIRAARVRLGESHVDAAGTLLSGGRLSFNAEIALGEIGRMLRWPGRPEGRGHVRGSVELRSQGWRVNGSLEAANLGWTQGATRLGGLNLSSTLTADRARIELGGVSLTGAPFGPGGGFGGAVRIRNLSQFEVTGALRQMSVGWASGLFLGRPLGFAGRASGPVEVRGDFRRRRELSAQARLGIVPGGAGVPLGGRVNLRYDGRADTLVLGPSQLTLPHTRIELAGALDRRIDVRLVSHDLQDLAPFGPIPLQLGNGSASLTAVVSGRLSAPEIRGHAALTDFTVAGRGFSSFTGDFAASPTGISLANASLDRGPLGADFALRLGLRNWRAEPDQPLAVEALVRHADLADVVALLHPSLPASGALTAEVHLAGTLASPTGTAHLRVTDGSLAGEHFDSLTAGAALTPQSIAIPTLTVTAGPSRIDVAAQFAHPLNRLDQGTVSLRIAGRQIELANFRSLATGRGALGGRVDLNADLSGSLHPTPAGPQFAMAALNGAVAARHLEIDGRGLGEMVAHVSTAAGAIRYTVDSNFAGSSLRASGQSLLAGDHATRASLDVSNLPIETALELARVDVPVRGLLSASAQVSGTLATPHITASVNVAHGSAWQQPFDRLASTFTYSDTTVDLTRFDLTSGPATLTASGTFTHPPGDFAQGQMRFRAASSPIELARIPSLARVEPGLAGTVQLTAEGAATLRPGQAPLFSAFDADLGAHDLSLGGQPLGALTASAHTHGQETLFHLASNFARADIHGAGRLELSGDYPVSAQLGFTGLTYAALRPLLGAPAGPFTATADGSASLSGPLVRPADWRGYVEIGRFELRSLPPSAGRETRTELELRNSGPIAASLNRGELTLRNARLTGPYTQLSVSGTVPLTGAPLNVHADGNLNLHFLEALNADLYASGQVTLAAAVTGTLPRPTVNGRLQLSNASLSLATLPNGISRATGTIVFNGTDAVIENLTGESGGGTVTLSGIVSYGGAQGQMRLTLAAEHVWVEYPQNVTTEANARLTLVGTVGHSLLSGDVTILNVALHPQSDLGSLLAQAAARANVLPPTGAFLAGINFEVRIRTAPDVQFRTSLVQNFQAEANLTLRGSPADPGMLGRIVITQGEVLFFGAKYALNQGTISFYDPNRINPNLHIELETTVQGIDVTISVTGPMDRLNLSYRSDPPMQFADLVALLTSGRAAVSDPVLAAHTPALADQSFQQAGASALFGAVIAQPVTGRIQRLFGVTTLQVNPLIIGPTTNTTNAASLTLQQQVAPNITLTYIQDVSQSNPLAVQLQWDVNPRWSVVVQRDINGFFDLDFYWKRRFH